MHNKTTDSLKLLSLKTSSLAVAHATRREREPFRQLIDDWLLACASNGLSQKTINDYREKVEKFHWWWTTHTNHSATLGPHPESVTVKEIREYAVYLQADSAFRWGEQVVRGKTKLSPVTIASYGRSVKVFFNWLVTEGELERTPFNRATSFVVKKKDEPLIKVIEEEDVVKLFNYLTQPDRLQFFDGRRDLAIIAFMLDTGVRKGELLNIHCEDLELRKNRCFVKGKTGERWVHFSDGCREVLSVYHEAREALSEYVLPPEFWITVEITPLSHYGLASIVRRAKERSGVNFHAHQLRHTFATILTSSGVGIADLARLMGHSQISTTMRYIHQNKERLGEVYKPMSPLRNMKDVNLSLKKKPGKPRREG